MILMMDLIRSIAFGILFTATPALEQFDTQEIDTIEIRESEEAYAEIVYKNSKDLNSFLPETQTLNFKNLEVYIVFDVTPGPEKLWIRPKGSYIAIPNYVEVDDGDSVTIYIYPASF